MKKKHNQAYFKSFDINNLNKELPVNLRYLEQVIDIVSKQYPTLKKPEVASISKALMEEIRAQLLDGNSIRIRDFLFDMQLYTFAKLRKNKIIFNTKVQVSTPKRIRNNNARN